MIAELHVDVPGTGVMVLLEQWAELVRLRRRKTADDEEAVLLGESAMSGGGEISEAVEASLLDGGNFPFERPGLFCRRRVAERPEVGDVTEDGFAGVCVGHSEGAAVLTATRLRRKEKSAGIEFRPGVFHGTAMR
jgi:hypothetical protein